MGELKKTQGNPYPVVVRRRCLPAVDRSNTNITLLSRSFRAFSHRFFRLSPKANSLQGIVIYRYPLQVMSSASERKTR